MSSGATTARCARSRTARCAGPAWDALVGRLGVPVRLLHRNEQGDALRATVRDQLPCIVVRGAGAQRVLLGPADLEACGADLDELERRIRRALRVLTEVRKVVVSRTYAGSCKWRFADLPDVAKSLVTSDFIAHRFAALLTSSR